MVLVYECKLILHVVFLIKNFRMRIIAMERIIVSIKNIVKES